MVSQMHFFQAFTLIMFALIVRVNETLLQNATSSFYQIRKKLITKCVIFFITKCYNFFTKCDSYYKM